MANDTTITVIGNLTSDPELRFTPSGSAVTNFTIASTPRTFDKNSNEWKDGETLFLRSSIWREAAENTAESLTKGMRVIAQGRLKSRSYEDAKNNNEKRTVIEFEVDEIGPSLQYAKAQVTRIAKGQQQGQSQQAPAQGNWNQQPAAAQSWGNGPGTQQGTDNSPPF